jgi:hypothetical protein
MPFGRISGHVSVLIKFGPHSWNYSRQAVAFGAARPQLSGVARLALALSSCGFSKLPRFLSDKREIHGLSVGPGFPKLRGQLSRALGTVQQSVREYLIEGPELFAVHRALEVSYPAAGRREIHGLSVGPGFPQVARATSEKFMARRSTPGFPELRELGVQCVDLAEDRHIESMVAAKLL